MVDVDSDIVTSDGVWGKALTPSYRAMYFAIKLKTTNTDIGVPTVSQHSLPIMIYPPTMTIASRSAITRPTPCIPGTEWPKVLSDRATDGTYSTLTGLNID